MLSKIGFELSGRGKIDVSKMIHIKMKTRKTATRF